MSETNENKAAVQKPEEKPEFVLEQDGEQAAFCFVDGHLFQPMRWKTKKGYPAGNFFLVYDAYGQPNLVAVCKDHRAVFDRTKLLVFLKPRELTEKAQADVVHRFDSPRFFMRDPVKKDDKSGKQRVQNKTS